jgi:hypothetical protein
MASGDLGHENLARALSDLSQALVPGILCRLPTHCRLMQAILVRLRPA